MPVVPTRGQVEDVLATVIDPEIRRPITELGMVKSVEIGRDGRVDVAVWLTVTGCPMRETIIRSVSEAASRLPGVAGVEVELDVMSAEQRSALQTQLRGGKPAPEIPFAQPNSLTWPTPWRPARAVSVSRR